jgi:hypothetical protein
MSNYPTGFQGGLMLDGLATHKAHTGKVFYVGSGSAGTRAAVPNSKEPSNSNPGTYLQPLKTLAYAVEQCADARGDVIVCLPGMIDAVETSIDIEAGNVTIIGAGTGNDRPQLTPGVLNALDVEGDNVTIQNMYFNEADAEIVTSLDVVGAGFRFLGNHMDLGANDDNPITVTATGETPVFADNKFVVTADGTVAVIDIEGVIDNPQFLDNVCVTSVANFDQGFVDMEAIAVTNALFSGNKLIGGGTELVSTAAVGTWRSTDREEVRTLLCAASTDDDESVIADVTGIINVWGIASFVETAMVVGTNYGVTADGNGAVLIASTAEGADEQGTAGDLTYAATAGGVPVEVEVGAVPATLASVIWPSPIQCTAGAIVMENTGAATGDWDHTIFWSPVSSDGNLADE